ncbi:MAG: UbiA prenyltransferase family protein [Nitrososphaeria archaeon]|nr:UbiA family prenyltransferase [Conexivisphaerales archaeon]
MKELITLVKSRASVLAYVAAFDSTLIVASGLRVSPIIFIVSTVSVYLISLANYILSDLLDIEEDRINNPQRPLASGAVNKNVAVYFITALLAVSLVLGYYVNLKFDLLLIFSFILALIYSGPKIRAKSKWWSKLAIAGIGTFIDPFTVSSITGLSLPVLFMSIIYMLWGFFTLNVGDVLDYEGDKKTGVMTFAVTFGKEKAITFLKIILFAQLIAEISLALSVNFLDFVYIAFSGFLFVYFFKGLLKLDNSKDQKSTGKKLKKMTRISMIVLQLVTLSLLF